MQIFFHKRVNLMLMIGLISALLIPANRPVHAASTFVVDTLSDGISDGSCLDDCTLREALALSASGDTITFSVSGTIQLTENYLEISSSKIIQGPGADQLTIQSDIDGSSVFYIPNNSSVVSISGMTISGGYLPLGSGAGIYNNGTLTVENIVLTDNYAGDGGAIYNNQGTLTISESTISSNTATGWGGGVYNNKGTVTIKNSTFRSNTSNQGGAITSFSDGTAASATISNSTFSSNSATSGNGIGGAINTHASGAATATTTIINSTITGNFATYGGGVASSTNNSGGSTSTITMKNSIVYGNTGSGPNCASINTGASLVGDANNLFATTAAGCPLGTSDVKTSVASSAVVDALVNNGGPTETRTLASGSPAIDAGDNTICTTSPISNKDQRGVTRPIGSQCDIGAVEGQNNDELDNAKSIETLPYNDTIDVTVMSQNASDPDNVGPCEKDKHLNIGQLTVWYKYVATSDETIFIDTVGSDYDTYIAVWETDTTNLIVCNDDSLISGLTSRVTANLISGKTYYIEAAQYNGLEGGVLEEPSGETLKLHVDRSYLDLDKEIFNFGDQLFRTSNPPEVFTITNSYGSDVTLGTLQGSSDVGTTFSTSQSFFIEDDNCSGVTLGNGETCTFAVRFLPWSLGDKTAIVFISSDTLNQMYAAVVSLYGNAVPGTQLLSNRSYENSFANGFPKLWSTNPLLKAGQDTVDSSWAFHGTYSFKFVGDGDLKVISQQVNKSGVPGDDFSMFIVTHGNNIPANSERWLMQIMFYNGNTIVENRNVPLQTGTYVSSRKTVMYTATTNYTKIVFRIHFGKSSGAGWIDLASLTWAP